MNHFPDNIRFKYPWRAYQQRVLKELDEHLNDDHLHIIAPPGSGKTILGLEVALRLNKPTLILTPTLAIRNQWIQRFCELFLQKTITPEWISRDIRNPGFLTVTTYQSLHAACTGSPDPSEDEDDESTEDREEKANNTELQKVVKTLRSKKVKTIVVDEAHHLKNAWWASLNEVKKAINPVIVGLTATPPYDVTFAEWQRYTDLNGPVDAEISVPELVAEGDLSPHQDYVMFSLPTQSEKTKLDSFRLKTKTLFEEIQKDQHLINALKHHPIILHPSQNLDWIYTNLECYSAALIFLNATKEEISKEHLNVIGDQKLKIPYLDYEWIEILLSFYLFRDPENFQNSDDHQEKLINKLRRAGLLERKTISFRHNRNLNKHLNTSVSKLNSINRIVEFEHIHLGQGLRMVILTDYIRKEFLVNSDKNNVEINKIGVAPIFEFLRRNHSQTLKIGVLSGSIIIIPKSAFEAAKTVALRYGIEDLKATELPLDNAFLIIQANEKVKHDIVHIITQIFEAGHIEVLIGTKSLLGEGWDAPSINSLILASFVGSFVSSNQMRGRAIRKYRKNLDKTGNIWHLVCIDPTAIDFGDDLQMMKRRFKAFVGVSFREKISIENGIDRLLIPEDLSTSELIESVNERMLNQAKNRKLLYDRWQEAIRSGRTLIEEIKLPFRNEGKSYQQVKTLYYNKTIRFTVGMLLSGIGAYSIDALHILFRQVKNIGSLDDLKNWLLVLGGFGVLMFGRQAFKTFSTYVKYRDISKDIHHMAEALLKTLIEIGAIQTNQSNLKIMTDVDEYGAIYCHLEGGSTFEKSTFIQSLEELISTVDNPRYVIIRKSSLFAVISQKDFHPVPEIIGRKKRFAEYLKKQWTSFVGDCELVYTRTIDGRKTLLKSRVHALSAQFEEKTQRINKWK